MSASSINNKIEIDASRFEEKFDAQITGPNSQTITELAAEALRTASQGQALSISSSPLASSLSSFSPKGDALPKIDRIGVNRLLNKLDENNLNQQRPEDIAAAFNYYDENPTSLLKCFAGKKLASALNIKNYILLVNHGLLQGLKVASRTELLKSKIELLTEEAVIQLDWSQLIDEEKQLLQETFPACQAAKQ
jgi:hypothetical protein